MKNNPNNQFKSKINKLIINVNNANHNNIKLPKIIDDYEHGYIYGNVKIHKPGYPLRPIISQVTTTIYQFTKTINELITPYLSYNSNIKSTEELIEILKTHKPKKGIISSLDVENLFTNVPVLETINIIINNIYHHPMIPPLKINSNTLHKIRGAYDKFPAFFGMGI